MAPVTDPTGTDATHPITTPVVSVPVPPLEPDPTGTDSQHPATTPVVPTTAASQR
jgi:hypothetical protein